MIYMDLEKIYRERDIPNKYILTLVVAARARQLSERKGALTGYEEKFYALGTPIHRVEAVVVTKQPRPADAKEPEEAEAGEDA